MAAMRSAWEPEALELVGAALAAAGAVAGASARTVANLFACATSGVQMWSTNAVCKVAEQSHILSVPNPPLFCFCARWLVVW